MKQHSVPSVFAEDGEVDAVDGIECGNEALAFLRDVGRVFL